MQDRRNDVGSKIALSVMGSTLMIFIGLFINAAWATAHDGILKATDAQMRVIALEAQFTSVRSDLQEIKALLRRGIPNSKAKNPEED